MTKAGVATVTAVLALAGNGCGGTETAARNVAPTVAESASIAIVTNLPASMGEVPERVLSPEPVVNIGSGAQAQVPLSKVTAILPLGDDRVAVGTDDPPRVVVLKSDGSLIATLGRGGQGPGEFSQVQSVVSLGHDSLGVWDSRRRRLSIFDEAGAFARELDLTDLAPGLAGNTFTPGGTSYVLSWDSTSMILFGVGIFDARQGIKRVEASSYRIAADGTKLDTYGPFPGIETFLTPQAGAGFLPFGAQTYAATSGGVLAVGTADSPELRFYSLKGVLVRIIRWPDSDRSIKGPLLAKWTKFADSWVASMPEGRRDRFRHFLDQMPKARQFPAYDGLLATDDGEFWVGSYPGQLSLPGTPLNLRPPARRWLVFSATGGLIATVESPEGFQPYAVAASRVWGVFRDSLDVESVRAFSVESH